MCIKDGLRLLLAYNVGHYGLAFKNLLHVSTWISSESKIVARFGLIKLDHDGISLTNGDW